MIMRQFLAAGLAVVTLASGWGMAVPAQADDHATYYNACVKTSGNKTLCACLADQAMSADPQLRADMILSMSDPNAYRTKRAPHVPNNGPEMQKWEAFDVMAHHKCGMDI